MGAQTDLKPMYLSIAAKADIVLKSLGFQKEQYIRQKMPLLF